MTDYKMTDERRKLLTEKLLGECWHIPKVNMEPLAWVGGQGTHCFICKRCGNPYPITWQPSTFTTDTDMLAVFRKIRDKGKLRDFINYVCSRVEATIPRQPVYFMQWLFLDNPERACCLAADFWEEHG
jgi:hypothetical protein